MGNPVGLGPKALPEHQVPLPRFNSPTRAPLNFSGRKASADRCQKGFLLTSCSGAPGTRFVHLLQQLSSCISTVLSDLCSSHSVIRSLRGGSVSCSFLDPLPLCFQHVLQALRSVMTNDGQHNPNGFK